MNDPKDHISRSKLEELIEELEIEVDGLIEILSPSDVLKGVVYRLKKLLEKNNAERN